MQKIKKIDRPVFALWLVLFRFLASFSFFASSNWPDQLLIQTCLFNCARKKNSRDTKICQMVQKCILKTCAKNCTYWPKCLYVIVILLTSPTAFSSFLLLLCLFGIEFSKHVYIFNFNMNALNVNISLFSKERSMQQEVSFWNLFCFQTWLPPKINFQSFEMKKEEFDKKKRSFDAVGQIWANLFKKSTISNRPVYP